MNVLSLYKSWKPEDQAVIKLLQEEEEKRTGKKPGLSEIVRAVATDAELSA